MNRRCLLLLMTMVSIVFSARSNDVTAVTAALFSRGGYSDDTEDASKKWSSFFAVDPSKILSVLVKRGGLVLPRSVEKELLALASVVSVDKASLNLVERILVVKNFTVTAPGSDRESLRVGSVSMTWDSYIKPCVDIEVEEVNVLVEFTNLVLTKSNWNELEDAGFPPMMEEVYDESAPSSTFVRIGSIQLSGNVTCEVNSRPLDRIIANISFPMHAFDSLNNQIRNASEANIASSGRRGCTTDELYTLVQSYFIEKLRKFLSDAIQDVTFGSMTEEGSQTMREAKKLFASASDVVKSYAGDAGKKTGDNLQETLASRLEKLGVPSSRQKLTALRDLSTRVAQSIDAKSLAGTQLNRIRDAYQNSREVDDNVANAALVYKTRRSRDDNENDDDADASKNAQVTETIVFFPDW